MVTESRGDHARATVPLDAVPAVAPRCAWQSLDGEAVIIDLVSRRVLGLNPSGSLLWSAADGRRTVRELATTLAEHFRLAPEAALADARGFFGTMAARGLVELRGAP